MDPNTTTLFAGIDFGVTHIDGTTETVKIRQLPIRDFQALQVAACNNDERAMAEVYTGRDKAWFDTLTIESQTALIQAGDKVNESFFYAWLQRLGARREAQMPGITEKICAGVMTSLNSALSPPPASDGRESKSSAIRSTGSS